MRVYVPATLPLLASYVAGGGIGPAPIEARAVTEWLRAATEDLEEEDREYAALMAAADDSVTLLSPADPPRRVVLAVDVDGVLESDESSRVEVTSAFSMSQLKAVHTDTDDIEAGAAYDPKEWGDLAWFGVQEIPDLLA